MRATFLDTSYFIALEWVNDQSHASAVAHWPRQVASRNLLVTTSFIIDEIVTFLVSRGLHRKAVEAAEWLLSSPSIDVVWVDEELFREGLEYLARRPDKIFSLTDCISFVVMNRFEIRDALTFDAHFEQAGFVRLPGNPS